MARDDDDKRSMSPFVLDDSHPSPSNLNSPRLVPLWFFSRRRRLIVTTAAALSALSLLALAYLSTSRHLFLVSRDPVAPEDAYPSRDRKSALLGPPTTRFRGSPQGCPTFFLHDYNLTFRQSS